MARRWAPASPGERWPGRQTPRSAACLGCCRGSPSSARRAWRCQTRLGLEVGSVGETVPPGKCFTWNNLAIDAFGCHGSPVGATFTRRALARSTGSQGWRPPRLLPWVAIFGAVRAAAPDAPRPQGRASRRHGPARQMFHVKQFGNLRLWVPPFPCPQFSSSHAGSTKSARPHRTDDLALTTRVKCFT